MILTPSAPPLQGVRDDGADFGRRRIVARDRAAGPEDQQAADVDAGAEALHAVEQGFGRAAKVDAGRNSGERKHAEAQSRVPGGPFSTNVHVSVDHARHDPQPVGVHNLGRQGAVDLRLDAVYQAVRDGHVGDGLQRVGRVENGASCNQQIVLRQSVNS